MTDINTISAILKYTKALNKEKGFKCDFGQVERCLKYKLTRVSEIDDVTRLASTIRSIQDGSAGENEKQFESEIFKLLEGWSNSKMNLSCFDNKYSAKEWLENHILWSSGEDPTDKMGRTKPNKLKACDKAAKERTLMTKMILEENPEIIRPKDSTLGLNIANPMFKNARDEIYMRRAIQYIENGWNPEWSKEKNEKSVTTKKLNKQMECVVNRVDVIYFATFKEANIWARNNPGKIVTRSPDGNGFVVKK